MFYQVYYRAFFYVEKKMNSALSVIESFHKTKCIFYLVSVLEQKLILKTKKELKVYQILKNIYYCQFSFKFVIFPLC